MPHVRLAAGLVGATFCAMLAAPPAAAEAQQFELDPEHTSIAFLVQHVGYYDQIGLFREASGSFTYNEETRELSDVVITIDTDSVYTAHEERDKHLRSADFLNTAEFPEMTFRATSAQPTGDDTGVLEGELTLLGVTRPVTLELTLNDASVYPFGHGLYTIGIDARGTIRRSDFGMTYAVDNGLVGDEVELLIGFEANLQGQDSS